ncbi:relaxin-3 receptor 1-like [Mustelus asterias]
MMSDWDLDHGVNDSYWEVNGTLSLEPDSFGDLGDVYVALRVTIVLMYCAVCGVGLLGNALVLYLNRGIRGPNGSTVDVFVANLALTDLQFVLALPFWAAEVALDHAWPFGDAACKLVLFATVLNAYASVFFLTAMSVSRYRAVVQALGPGRAPFGACGAKWASLAIWLVAIAASLAPAIYSKTVAIHNKEFCIQKFPEGQYLLALQHIQKIALSFIIPLVLISMSYLLLINFLRRHTISGGSRKRQSKVNRSVLILILSFFLCWLPNHVITCWGVLVKLELISWNRVYYISQSYVHPLTICLAHANSCLNPVIYCLMRREFRESLKTLYWRISMGYTWVGLTNSRRRGGGRREGSSVAVALRRMERQPDSDCPDRRGITMPATTSSLLQAH